MEELTRLRVKQGWSQQRLADESSVNKATINQIERGRRSPNVETLEKLADALGVSVADLFPKAQAPLWSDESSDGRRYSILPEVIVATVDKWIDIVSDPDTNGRESFGIAAAASTLGNSIENLVGEASWDSLTGREQRQIIRVMEKISEVFECIIQLTKEENLEEEVKQRREQIRELTRRISA